MGENDMRCYHDKMDKRMFDFEDFYQSVAERLPDRAVIAEVGIGDGVSSIYLAEALINLGKPFKLIMIDNLAYGREDQLATILNHICQANLGRYVQMLPTDSLNACCRYPDGYFDFVFLDSSHKVEPTKLEILGWYRKINEGGILAGHDYNSGEGAEVKLAVDTIIPEVVVRSDIPERAFEPEQVLHIEATERGCGVWWVQKRFYVKLC